MKSSSPSRSEWTADLLIATLLTVVAAGVLLGPDIGWPIEEIAGVLLLMVLPGYAVVSALFPEQPSENLHNVPVDSRASSPDWTVRLILSFVGSLIIVAAVGILLNFQGAIRLTPVIGALVGVTLVGIVITAVRRSLLPGQRRARPFAGRTLWVFSTGTRVQSVVLVLSLLALVSTIAVIGVAPSQGETFSETYLLTEAESGELVAEEYPTTFVAGDGHSLTVGIENHEHRTVSYEVAVVVQEIGPGGSIENQQPVDQFNATVAHGERALLDRQIDPTMTGEGLRLQFLVYNDTSPEDIDPSEPDSADQTLHIWIDVVEQGGV